MAFAAADCRFNSVALFPVLDRVVGGAALLEAATSLLVGIAFLPAEDRVWDGGALPAVPAFFAAAPAFDLPGCALPVLAIV